MFTSKKDVFGWQIEVSSSIYIDGNIIDQEVLGFSACDGGGQIPRHPKVSESSLAKGQKQELPTKTPTPQGDEWEHTCKKRTLIYIYIYIYTQIPTVPDTPTL